MGKNSSLFIANRGTFDLRFNDEEFSHEQAVEDFDEGAALVDALHDADAVGHGSRGSVPFGENENVVDAEGGDRFFKFGAVSGAGAGLLFGENPFAARASKRRQLTIEFLALGVHPGVTEFHAFSLSRGHLFRNRNTEYKCPRKTVIVHFIPKLTIFGIRREVYFLNLPMQ